MSGHGTNRPAGAGLRRRSLLVAALGLMPAAAGLADAASLKDVLARGKIIVGVVNDFPPFGFLDAQQQPQGYDIDVARLIAKDLGVELELVAVSAANRIPYLVSDRVDILVASLGITPERAKQVLFTIPYAATQSTILAPKQTRITSLADLAGKRIAVARGSSNDIFIRELAPAGTNLMRFDGEGAASQAMLAGQVDGLVITNTMVPAVVASRPDLQLETKLVLKHQENAIAVRRDTPELEQRISGIIRSLKKSGKLDELYRKWVGGPLPNLSEGPAR